MSEIKIKKAKEMAAKAALSFVKDYVVLGVGSGSTVELFIKLLAEKIKNEELKGIRAVPTSFQVAYLLTNLGIPALNPWNVEKIDLTVDGADEIDKNYYIIKGGGGALLREKIVAYNSDKYIVIADYTKFTDRICTRSAIPIEAHPFATKFVLKKLQEIGHAKIRFGLRKVGPIVTDNGNLIIDFTPKESYIKDPLKLEFTLKRIPGVIETGLFIGFADVIIKGLEEGYKTYNIR